MYVEICGPGGTKKGGLSRITWTPVVFGPRSKYYCSIWTPLEVCGPCSIFDASMIHTQQRSFSLVFMDVPQVYRSITYSGNSTGI